MLVNCQCIKPCYTFTNIINIANTSNVKIGWFMKMCKNMKKKKNIFGSPKNFTFESVLFPFKNATFDTFFMLKCSLGPLDLLTMNIYIGKDEFYIILKVLQEVRMLATKKKDTLQKLLLKKR